MPYVFVKHKTTFWQCQQKNSYVKAKTFQILPSNYRISFVRAKVMVHEHLDGSIHIIFKEQELRHKQVHKNKQKALLLVAATC